MLTLIRLQHHAGIASGVFIAVNMVTNNIPRETVRKKGYSVAKLLPTNKTADKSFDYRLLEGSGKRCRIRLSKLLYINRIVKEHSVVPRFGHARKTSVCLPMSWLFNTMQI